MIVIGPCDLGARTPSIIAPNWSKMLISALGYHHWAYSWRLYPGHCLRLLVSCLVDEWNSCWGMVEGSIGCLGHVARGGWIMIYGFSSLRMRRINSVFQIMLAEWGSNIIDGTNLVAKDKFYIKCERKPRVESAWVRTQRVTFKTQTQYYCLVMISLWLVLC